MLRFIRGFAFMWRLWCLSFIRVKRVQPLRLRSRPKETVLGNMVVSGQSEGTFSVQSSFYVQRNITQVHEYRFTASLFISKSINANRTTINNKLHPPCVLFCDASAFIYRMLHVLISVIIIKNKIIVTFLTVTVYWPDSEAQSRVHCGVCLRITDARRVSSCVVTDRAT